MSNLLKQYYVVSSSEEKRVINYNAMAEEKIRSQLAEKQPAAKEADAPEPEPDGDPGEAEFTAGIAAAAVQVAPQPDPGEIAQQIIAEARGQAERICGEADERARRILEDAQNQARLICEEQREIGYREGAQAREDELARQQQQLDTDRRVHEEDINRRSQELEADYRERQERMETDIIDALIPVFEKVFRIQFGDKREILLALAQNVLSNVELGSRLRIRANEADTAMLKEHSSEIRRQVGAEVSLELIQDAGMADGQCQIETSYGVFDCGIGTHFENLIKDIRSLI